MADQITLQVARYRPDRQSAPTFQEYEVPVQKDWVDPRRAEPRQGPHRRHAVVPLVVPDGRLRQLRHDRQRRAEADLRHVPHRLRTRPGARGAAPQLSRHPRSDRRPRRLHAQAGEREAVARAQGGEADQRGRVPPVAGRARRRTSSSACASTACSATRPAPSTAWTRSSSARRRIALAQRYNLDSRDQGGPERMEVLSTHEGVWGCTFVGECTKVCPKNVDPAGAIQRYKLEAALDWVKGVVMPWGGR